MKRIWVAMGVITLIIAACNQSGEVDRSDALTAGRGFIEASLKGDYITARKYLLEDSTNLEYFDGFKDFNNKLSKEDRRGYIDANIIIDSSIEKSDSVNVIYYSNTYKNKPAKIKVVKHNNEWFVDFKYTFNNN